MKITIDRLTVTVERDDGALLEFDLSDAGLTTTTSTLIIETGETAELTITVPFQPPASEAV